MQKVIGGEFDIDISQLAESRAQTGYYYSSGRAALYNILIYVKQNLHFRRILLPDYLCESVLDVVQKFQYEIAFYSLNDDLSVNRTELAAKLTSDSIVLLVNYFGCVPCAPQTDFIRTIAPEACIIEDNVMAYFAMDAASDADFSFTSFRKTFAVPDGGWVLSKYNSLPDAEKSNTFASFKIAGGIVKNIAKENPVDDNVYLKLFSDGETLIDDNYESRISPVSLKLLSATNTESIAEIRRANANYLIHGLREIGIKPLFDDIEDIVPLFVPILLKDRDDARSELFKNNIFCPVHWPAPKGSDMKRGAEMAATELSLIIDQRYDSDDMQRMLDVLQKFS